MIDSWDWLFSEWTEVPMDFFGIFRKRLELYLPYFNTSLLYGNQQTKIGAEQANLKRVRAVCLRSTQRECGRDTAPLRSLLHRHGSQVLYCTDTGPKFSTAQTRVPSSLLHRHGSQVLYCTDTGPKFSTAQTRVPSSLLHRHGSQVLYCADLGENPN